MSNGKMVIKTVMNQDAYFLPLGVIDLCDSFCLIEHRQALCLLCTANELHIVSLILIKIVGGPPAAPPLALPQDVNRYLDHLLYTYL